MALAHLCGHEQVVDGGTISHEQEAPTGYGRVQLMSISIRAHYSSCGEERPIRRCSEGLKLSPALFSSAVSFGSIGNMGFSLHFHLSFTKI